MSYASLYPDIGYPDLAGCVTSYPEPDPAEKNASGTPLHILF
jgi:hypothetical protein